MQARQSYVSVKYNGKDITKKITDYTEGFEYVDNASGTADTVSLKLNNRSGVWWGGWIPIQGDYVEATIKTTNWNKEGDNRSLNCGYFLIDDLGYSGPPQIATIGGIATPINTDFNVTKKSKTWKKTSACISPARTIRSTKWSNPTRRTLNSLSAFARLITWR